MPSIPFAKSANQRAEGDLPALRCKNMYAEKALGDNVILQSRPGLDDLEADMGDGPVVAVFRRDGVFDEDLFGVSDGNLYRGTTLLGTIPGTGFISIAGNEIGLMIASGSTLRYYNGTTVADVTFPDSADVTYVFAGGSRFWLIREDTGKIYWTDALEADVESLDFATAESMPDKLLQGLWIDGNAVLFGAESIEFWQTTGDSTLPITPMIGMVVEKGLRATGCATPIANTFAWVGDDNVVYLSNENTPISEEWLNDEIAASAGCSLFTFLLSGVDFLCLRLDTATYVYRQATGTWHEWDTYGETNFIGACYAAGVFGSGADGKILEWGSDKTDAPSVDGIMTRLFGAGFSIDGGMVPVTNLRLRCNTGGTPYLSGDYADPQVEMRFSADGGKTWTDWDGVSLGEQGSYGAIVEWRALGDFSYPGFLCEFRVTAPVPFRVSDVLVNEPWGGRG